MANFDEHIIQAKNNLRFLEQVNTEVGGNWDWQVTVCFYSALHLVNAHVVAKTGKNYLTHGKVAAIINPYTELSVAKLNEDVYNSYIALSNLSRRSRYLINEKAANRDDGDVQVCCITHSKHFKKAIHHLNIIISYLSKEHKTVFGKTSVSCLDLNGQTFDHFTVQV